MVLPGHLAGGYLFTTGLLSLSPVVFSTQEATALLIIGTILGEAPDIDLFRYYFQNKPGHHTKVSNHREYLTHAPFLWFGLGMLVAALGLLFSSAFVITLGFVIWTASWSHFLFDSIEIGVPWLWPFSRRFYALKQLRIVNVAGQKGTFSFYWKIIIRQYVKQWTFYAEIIVVAVAMWVFLR